ncbi:MAG: hypothetical protein RR202_10490 [Bacteroidales bacterium]
MEQKEHYFLSLLEERRKLKIGAFHHKIQFAIILVDLLLFYCRMLDIIGFFAFFSGRFFVFLGIHHNNTMGKIERFKVPLIVPAILKEFIMSTNKSAVITPKKRDFLWLLVKQHLVTSSDPDLAPAPKDGQDVIWIELLNVRNRRMCSYTPSKNDPSVDYLHVDTLFRNNLSVTGQKVIAAHLYKVFKENFHNFMAASLIANPNQSYSAVIRSFMDMYEIDQVAIKETMLMKSWQRDWRYKWLRSPQRAMLDTGLPCCSLIF